VRVAVGGRGHLSIVGGRGHLSIVGGRGHLSFAPTLSVTYRGNSSYGIGLDAIQFHMNLTVKRKACCVSPKNTNIIISQNIKQISG
jgi:hypothetical protein